MKFLSSIIFAGACAATFSGCYMDRQPTMTLEERAMASDKELADYETKKAAEASKKSGSVESKAVSPNLTGEINSPVPAADRQFGEFSGRKFMTGIVHASDDRNIATLEIWAQSTSGVWQKIASAEFDEHGILVPFLDTKAGFVAVYKNKNSTEFFMYNLTMAPR